ncbi:MAG TPA: hypothetical protein VK909_14945 [Anaerolineales bacterium]|nr:hypothetical protein [Anaerolineales bacterium]
MLKATISQKVILAYSFFIVVVSIFLLGGMFRSPSEPQSSIIFGLSLLRLLIAFGFLIAGIFFAALGFKAFQDQKWAETFLEWWFGEGPFSKAFFWLAGVSLGLGWVGCFIPSYRVGLLRAYWDRIQPMMVFILAVSIATVLVFIARRTSFSKQKPKTADVFRLGFILFLISLPVLAWSTFNNYDAYRLEDFWYGAAVPILASQLMVAISAGILFLSSTKNLDTRSFDVIIFLLLFIGTAILWAREPLHGSFLFTGPTAPNKVFYPFADAATFDIASQFGLIGQGIYIFNTPFFERTLYISFLIYLHSLFGQDYQTLMTVQAVIFAIFPALVYSIGRSLNMRAVGLAAAIIAAIRGANAIAASNMIDLANPKMIMTDFPTAIGLALLILLLCEWLKEPEKKWSYALWCGGVVGFTMMIRTNALIFLPLIPLYVLLRYLPRWKHWLLASTLTVLAVIAITLPWELRNVSRGALPYSPILTKIQQVLQMRYSSPSGSVLPQENFFAAATLQATTVLSSSLFDGQVQACQTVACFAPKHFVHNVITSILLFPTSPVFDDLRHTVKGSNPYWRQDWDGRFNPSALLFFSLNIFFITLGISAAWKREHLAGIAPLAIFVFYDLSDALARTSGGRYIVPMDWILSLYYVIGILFLFTEIAVATNMRFAPLFDPGSSNSSTPSRRSGWATTITILLVLFVVGSLVPLSEKLHPPRYANFNVSEALQRSEQQVASAGLAMGKIDSFLKNPGAQILVGRTLYPRSYKLGQGEFYFSPYTVMDFPRTAFVLIGPNGADGVVVPGGFPKYFPHAADALVIGCKEATYTDALAVILLDGTGTVYLRSPMSELTCPLRQPVCTNNAACR